jgi:hypothetical protein
MLLKKLNFQPNIINYTKELLKILKLEQISKKYKYQKEIISNI